MTDPHKKSNAADSKHADVETRGVGRRDSKQPYAAELEDNRGETVKSPATERSPKERR
jgi:hypothetical protein